MTLPDPLDDQALDRLLDAHVVAPLSPDFARRVTDEAMREDRPTTLPPFPSRPHKARRPWARRRLVAAVVAVNLIVASAIAATFSGHFPALQHVAIAVARVLHIRHHHAPVAPPVRADRVRLLHRVGAPVAAPLPPPPEPTPAELFAERHPLMARQLMAMQREGLIGPRPEDARRAILFAERHPFAARALIRRDRIARLRGLREADMDQAASVRQEPGPDRNAERRTANADMRHIGGQDVRPHLQDREAFEQERHALEQRANALWPEKRAGLRNEVQELQDKPIGERERKTPHHAGLRRNWHDRMRTVHPGRHRQP